MAWHRDKWEGLPGHDTSYQVPRFASEQYPQAAEISDVIRGWAVAEAMKQREVKFFQANDFCSFGQEPFFRMNTWEAACNTPIVHERVVSMSYTVWWMGAGAAHPNMHFKTFAFTLSPVSQIDLEGLFYEPDLALKTLQEIVRHQLLNENERFRADDPEGIKLDEDWVYRGTEAWGDFSAFVFNESGIDFLFAPYQVGAYAFGAHLATVPYDKIAKLIRRHYAFSLGIEYLQHDRPPVFLTEEAERALSKDDGAAGTAAGLDGSA